MVSALGGTLLLPLFGAVLLFFFGGTRRLPQPTAARWPGYGATAIAICSSVLSIYAVVMLHQASGTVFTSAASEWIPGFGAGWSLQLDWLSSWILLLVDVIGLAVTIYSLGYMRGEWDTGRYFGALLFFIANMKLLVLAGNYLLLFAGWEGVGLASYLLIGFHFERTRAAQAATKAFIVNRVGDAGLLLAIITMALTCGSTGFGLVAQHAPQLSGGTIAFICALLAIGAIGKSAQFPLHVWLPDAMEGPTPVSALIHSATMVCAGVYLLARSSFLLSLSPPVAMAISSLGVFTALFAATVALAENDIKRVLAYSTISQIGFMFIALGVGASRAAMFHVVTHAFFKALLFLGAGSVIHSLHGEQNLKHMGGLRTQLPVTFRTMWVAALTLAGVPGLAAFFSKDLILEASWSSGHFLLATVGLMTSALTACYAWRLMSLAFYGESRQHHLPVHPAPPVMQIPLIILAACCVLVGWIFVPIHWEAWPTMILSTVVAGAGIWSAWYFYVVRPQAREIVDQRFAPVARFLRNRWYIDAIYEQRILNGIVLGTAEGSAYADRFIIDGALNTTASLIRRLSRSTRWLDRSVIDRIVRVVSKATKFLSWPARAIQTGLVQTYALLFITGVVLALGYYLTR